MRNNYTICRENKRHKGIVENEGYEYVYTYERMDKLKDSGKILGVDIDTRCKRSFIRVKCPYCGNVYDIRFDSFNTDKHRCTNCCHKYENSLAYYIEVELGLKLEDMWDFEKNNQLEINPYYVTKGTNKKAYFKCKRGIHESEMRKISSFTKGNGCQKCKSEDTGNRKRLSYEYIKNKIEECEYKLLSKEYVNAHTKLNIECTKGHIYNVVWNSFQQGSRCPICNESKGEKEVEKILNKYSIKYILQYKIEELVGINGGNLSYDFYLPDYNLLIEYQGEQHDKAFNYFGGEEKLKKQQEHDKRKREYAKEHNIELLEIWYWDYDNIEDILKRYIK